MSLKKKTELQKYQEFLAEKKARKKAVLKQIKQSIEPQTSSWTTTTTSRRELQSATHLEVKNNSPSWVDSKNKPQHAEKVKVGDLTFINHASMTLDNKTPTTFRGKMPLKIMKRVLGHARTISFLGVLGTHLLPNDSLDEDTMHWMRVAGLTVAGLVELGTYVYGKYNPPTGDDDDDDDESGQGSITWYFLRSAKAVRAQLERLPIKEFTKKFMIKGSAGRSTPEFKRLVKHLVIPSLILGIGVAGSSFWRADLTKVDNPAIRNVFDNFDQVEALTAAHAWSKAADAEWETFEKDSGMSLVDEKLVESLENQDDTHLAFAVSAVRAHWGMSRESVNEFTTKTMYLRQVMDHIPTYYLQTFYEKFMRRITGVDTIEALNAEIEKMSGDAFWIGMQGIKRLSKVPGVTPDQVNEAMATLKKVRLPTIPPSQPIIIKESDILTQRKLQLDPDIISVTMESGMVLQGHDKYHAQLLAMDMVREHVDEAMFGDRGVVDQTAYSLREYAEQRIRDTQTEENAFLTEGEEHILRKRSQSEKLSKEQLAWVKITYIRGTQVQQKMPENKQLTLFKKARQNSIRKAMMDELLTMVRTESYEERTSDWLSIENQQRIVDDALKSFDDARRERKEEPLREAWRQHVIPLKSQAWLEKKIVDELKRRHKVAKDLAKQVAESKEEELREAWRQHVIPLKSQAWLEEKIVDEMKRRHEVARGLAEQIAEEELREAWRQHVIPLKSEAWLEKKIVGWTKRITMDVNRRTAAQQLKKQSSEQVAELWIQTMQMDQIKAQSKIKKVALDLTHKVQETADEISHLFGSYLYHTLVEGRRFVNGKMVQSAMTQAESSLKLVVKNLGLEDSVEFLSDSPLMETPKELGKVFGARLPERMSTLVHVKETYRVKKLVEKLPDDITKMKEDLKKDSKKRAGVIAHLQGLKNVMQTFKKEVEVSLDAMYTAEQRAEIVKRFQAFSEDDILKGNKLLFPVDELFVNIFASEILRLVPALEVMTGKKWTDKRALDVHSLYLFGITVSEMSQETLGKENAVLFTYAGGAALVSITFLYYFYFARLAAGKAMKKIPKLGERVGVMQKAVGDQLLRGAVNQQLYQHVVHTALQEKFVYDTDDYDTDDYDSGDETEDYDSGVFDTTPLARRSTSMRPSYSKQK